MLRKKSWFGILTTAIRELRIDTSISLWTTIFGALFVLASKFDWWIMCTEIFRISRMPYWLLLTEFLIYIAHFVMYSIIATLSPSCGCFPMLFHDPIFLPILSMMNMMIFVSFDHSLCKWSEKVTVIVQILLPFNWKFIGLLNYDWLETYHIMTIVCSSIRVLHSCLNFVPKSDRKIKSIWFLTVNRDLYSLLCANELSLRKNGLSNTEAE